MSIGRPPRAITVARIQAIDITLNWRWAPVLALATWLLAQDVLPARFPSWEQETTWITAAAAVIAGETALLLHELSHALVARCFGHRVRQIVFHGFLAETLVDEGPQQPAHVAVVALMGPSVNLALAGLAELGRITLSTQGPAEAFLMMLILGNIAAAVLSLLPLGASDGARALYALKQITRQREDEHDQ